MSLTLLKREVRKLPEAQRLKLASVLFDSVPAKLPADEEPLTIADLDRRAEELKSGKVKGIPADVVKLRIDGLMSKIKRDRQSR